jgi:hypothetical protein
VLYVAQRYLNLSAEQWGALSWDLQETYLTGLAQDPEVPFSREETPAWERAGVPAGTAGPVTRKAHTGAQVLDITAMIAELESNPDARKRS